MQQNQRKNTFLWQLDLCTRGRAFRFKVLLCFSFFPAKNFTVWIMVLLLSRPQALNYLLPTPKGQKHMESASVFYLAMKYCKSFTWESAIILKAWCKYNKSTDWVLTLYCSSPAHVDSYLSVLNVSLAINKTQAHIRGADVWLTSSQIGLLFFPLTGGNQGTEASLTTAHDHHQTKHYDCLLITLWLVWFDFGGFHSDEDCEWVQSSAVACHLSHMPQFHNDFMPQWVAHSVEKKCVFPAIYY